MTNTHARSRIGPRLLVLGVVVFAASAFELWPSKRAPSAKGEFRALCTFLPMYVFTLNVVGQTPGVQVELMLGQDLGCPHNYSLRPADLMRLGQANVVVANGLGLEPFLDQLAKSHPKLSIIKVSDSVDVLHAACTHEHHEHDHDHAVNGHAWVSPRQAAKQVQALAEKLAGVDPERGAAYRANAETYITRLRELDRRMTDSAKGFRNRAIVTTHDAFDYLAHDLELRVVATIQTEHDQPATASRLADVIEAIKREKVAAVFFDSPASERLAQTVARDASVKAYLLNPFTSLGAVPSANSYEDVMLVNLETLEQALGAAP